MAREAAVFSYGFKSKCSTLHVTELLRQTLHKSREWGFPAYIASAGVKTGFDSMRFNDIIWALQERGVDPWTVRAIMREYVDLEARASVVGSGCSAFFTYSRGGRQGGTETPDLFVYLLDTIIEPLQKQWRAAGYGVEFDSCRVTHVIWADNIHIFAAERPQMRKVISMLIESLRCRSLDLKLTEASFIKGMGTDMIDSSTEDIDILAPVFTLIRSIWCVWVSIWIVREARKAR